MKISSYFLIFISLIFCSCHPHEEYADNPIGNFDALWDILDTHYCFFPENGLDWEEVGRKYKAKIGPEISDRELFNICSEMLSELKDGHVNLTSTFDTYYFREWWTAYPQNFSLRTLQEYYLNFNWQTVSGMQYKYLGNGVAYLRCPSFSYPISENGLDEILAYFYSTKGLIIDIRDNGGGEITTAQRLIARFIPEKKNCAYLCHKTGTGHNDFSSPYPITISPASNNHLVWRKPIVVLINRSCFSAANLFASIMKSIPGVILIGSDTGGGGGLPFSSQLPNGWKVRFSAVPVTDENGKSIEKGISPSEGFYCVSTEEELAKGEDKALNRAIEYIESVSSPKD